MEETKDVTIKDVEYQIGRFKATDGSWILAQLMTKLLPAMIEGAFAKSGASLGANRSSLSEEEFANIQGHCLAVCRRYEKSAPMPVFLRPKTWAVKDLEYDVVTVMQLTIHALLFNMMPFFQGGGLLGILEASGALDLIPSLSNIHNSTASHSDPFQPVSGVTQS